MTALVHATTATLPDDPAYEIKTTQWNEAHVFTGAGTGEVVFVDASGHAATSPDLTFDAVSKTLGLGGTVLATPIQYGISPTVAFGGTPSLFITSLAGIGVGTAISLTNVDAPTTDYAQLDIGNDSSTGSFEVRVSPVGTAFVPPLSFIAQNSSGVDKVVMTLDGSSTLPSFALQLNGVGDIDFADLGAGPALRPGVDNAIDLGVDDGLNLNRFRTGYFGTSVVSPLFTSSAPGITDTIDLATATSISVAGGIITGWA